MHSIYEHFYDPNFIGRFCAVAVSLGSSHVTDQSHIQTDDFAHDHCIDRNMVQTCVTHVRSSDDFKKMAGGIGTRFSHMLTSALLCNGPAFETVVVPESADDFPGYHLAHVDPYQTHDKHPVSTQVVLGEFGQDACLALRGVKGSQLFADILNVSGPVEGTEEPSEEVDGRYDRQEDVPEPDEDEQLLVEEIYRQCALDDVVVHAGLMSDLEFAECDARESLGVAPVLSADHSFHDVHSVKVVVDLQKDLE